MHPQYRTQPSRVAEWADLVGESVPAAVVDEDGAEESSAAR
jgi:hypothetical protein